MMHHSGISCRGNDHVRHCEERSDEAIYVSGEMDCFAEPVIGPRFRANPLARNDGGVAV